MRDLPVIFRAEKSGMHKGEVTAVFPTWPAGRRGRDMTVYAHVGQHSAASFEWYRTTRPATADEYADLLVELRSIYGCGDDPWRLKICQRISPAHRAAFLRELEA